MFYLNKESETRQDDFMEKQIDDLEQELYSSNNRNNPLRYTDDDLITSIDIIHQQLQGLGNNTTRTHFPENVRLNNSAIGKNFEDKYAFLDFITCDMLYKTLGSDIDLENNITFWLYIYTTNQNLKEIYFLCLELTKIVDQYNLPINGAMIMYPIW